MYKILLITSLTVFISCTSKKEEPPKEKNTYEEKIELDSLNLLRRDKITKKYDAVSGWEKNNLFTYALKEKLLDSIISFTGLIVDIDKNGDAYILKIEGIRGYSAEIILSNLQFKNIISETSARQRFNRGCFIIKIKDIQSTESILNGELIDYYIYKTP